MKQYYEKNEERIKEKEVDYRNKNKELINEKRRQQYKLIKDEEEEKARIQVQCPICSCSVRKDGMLRHEKVRSI